MPAMHDLDPAQCERLLRRGTVGRVGLVTPDGPVIFPVNYAVHEDAVCIRTTADGALARFGHEQRVVFEVDTLDQDRWTGWSVLAHGRGLLDPHPGPRPLGERARPWADGERSAELRVAWTRLTGRRVGAIR